MPDHWEVVTMTAAGVAAQTPAVREAVAAQRDASIAWPRRPGSRPDAGAGGPWQGGSAPAPTNAPPVAGVELGRRPYNRLGSPDCAPLGAAYRPLT
ncbi:hypothetical protein [Nostocoides australiense]